MSIFKQSQESFSDYIGRVKYGLLRRIVPSLREQHRLGTLVGPARYWKQIQKYQFNFLTGMGLKPHHTFLDIGCGPLSAGLALIPYLQQGNYVGIDVREKSIAEAHVQVAKAGLAGKNPLLVVSRTFGRDELSNGCKFDYIWASQIFYHLDDKKLEDCFEQVSVRMKVDSKFYADILGYPNKVWDSPDLKWFEFNFYLHSLEALKDLAENYGLEMTCLGEIQEYGYPQGAGGLKHNKMLEFHRKSSG